MAYFWYAQRGETDDRSHACMGEESPSTEP